MNIGRVLLACDRSWIHKQPASLLEAVGLPQIPSILVGPALGMPVWSSVRVLVKHAHELILAVRPTEDKIVTTPRLVQPYNGQPAASDL